MDVQRFNFPARLLDIIEAVSESCFVAIDLELSGVPVRPFGVREAGRASLQERYTETKAAAERYQILQIGLTCVKEDVVDATYELKTFNVDLSPVLTERLDIDRTFSFHSGAVEFLNSVGFNFNAPLVIGVPYLSRDEAVLALQRAEDRISRSNGSSDPLNIKPGETESLKLLENVRKAIDEWARIEDDSVPLLLGPKELDSKQSVGGELSRYEKRLVHQIVRQYYPHLVTVPRRGNIQVQLLDEQREASIKRSKLRDTKERIQRQTGFRWVIEAMAGRSLGGIHPDYFTTDPQTGATKEASFDTKTTFMRCQHHLSNKPRPVVGHNMFLDLIYLYSTFIGELPEKVEDFAAAVHQLFPIIVDTKYLATHECGDINPMSSLQQLAEQMDEREKPLINVHKKYNKYAEIEAHHEAGYDSMMTAKVAIRLSAMLEMQKRSDVLTPSPSSDDKHSGGVSLRQSEAAGTLSYVTDALKRTVVSPIRKAVTAAVPTANGKTPPASRFAHSTAFDRLQEDTGDDAEDFMQFDSLPADNSYEEGLREVPDWEDSQEWTPLRLMPRWTADFWQEYGNRLRVFSTQEGLCVLDRSQDE